MATKSKQFDLFGVTYRTKQFAAIPALELMADPATHPTVVLRQTEVFVRPDSWLTLDKRDVINRCVVDEMHQLPPRMVLEALLKVVGEYSFGFANGWRGVKIPERFISGGKPKESRYVDPLVSQLLQDDVASLRELEEYYSLEDAFKMFDVMVAKGVNAAVANEEAMKASKRR
jgi:hypothetical protein